MWRVIERPPDFLARLLVEGNDACARFAADENDQQPAFDQRAGRELRKLLQSVILAENSLPDERSPARIECEQMPRCSQREYEAAFGDGRGTRSGRVLRIEPRVPVHFVL